MPVSPAPINLECTNNHTVSSQVTGNAFLAGTRGGAANLTFSQNTWQSLVADTDGCLDGDDALSTADAFGGGTSMRVTRTVAVRWPALATA